MDKKPVTVGTKEALGFGVIGLGLIGIFLPMMIQRIVDMGINPDGFAMLSGTMMVLMIFVIIAGIAITVAKLDEENEE